MSTTVLVESFGVARLNVRSWMILLLGVLEISFTSLILNTTIWILVRHIWVLEIVKSLQLLSLKWIFLFDLRMSLCPSSVRKMGDVLSEIRNHTALYLRAHGGKSGQTFAEVIRLLCDALNLISHILMLLWVPNQFWSAGIWASDGHWMRTCSSHLQDIEDR